MTPAARLKELESAAIHAIRTAFSAGEPPSADQMRNDHCPECADTNAIFEGKHWQEITVDTLRANPAVSLLTIAALRYYLPALMLRCIESPLELDTLPSGIVSHLSPPNGKPSARLGDLRRSFTRAQNDAVVSFLRVQEARNKISEYPEEAFDDAPATRVVTRAIEYWAG